MRYPIQAKPEFRKGERFGHKSIIKLEDQVTPSPYFAVSDNLSETGMYFKSMLQLYPGAHVLIKIDDYTLSMNQVPAEVVWCSKIEHFKGIGPVVSYVSPPIWGHTILAELKWLHEFDVENRLSGDYVGFKAVLSL